MTIRYEIINDIASSRFKLGSTLYLTVSLFTATALAADCPVSTPNMDDPPGALKTGDNRGWFGSEKLAVMIPADGLWNGMGVEYNYRDKSWWWYKGYRAQLGTAEKLSITARKLNNASEILSFSASNAYQGSDNYNWDAMSTGYSFPKPGCWQLTGYYENEELTFTLLVGE